MGGARSLFFGALIGAGVMYLLDPERGRRRRALLRDQAVHGRHELERNLRSTARDVRNRTGGALAEASARIRHERVEDRVLEGRVAAALGHAVDQLGAVGLDVEDGVVTLRGQAHAADIPALLHAARHVRGVRGVVNELRPPERAAAEPLPADHA